MTPTTMKLGRRVVLWQGATTQKFAWFLAHVVMWGHATNEKR